MKNINKIQNLKMFESKRFKSSKKAQINTQIFVYILAAVIIGLIVIVGYKSISSILQVTSQAPIDDFKATFEGKVSITARSYGKVEKYQFTLPDKFDQICFIDSLNDDDEFVDLSLPADANPIIKDVVDFGNKINVFILKDGTPEEEFYVENLDVAQDYLCLDNGDRLEVWFEGIGKKACLMFDDTDTC
jgi:hypothetical protein